jgi:hypothetical protein
MADCKTATVHNGKVQEGSPVRLLSHHAKGASRVSKVVRIARIGASCVLVYTEELLDDLMCQGYPADRLEIVNPDGSANASKAIHEALGFGTRRKGR